MSKKVDWSQVQFYATAGMVCLVFVGFLAVGVYKTVVLDEGFAISFFTIYGISAALVVVLLSVALHCARSIIAEINMPEGGEKVDEES